jgi:hypothetical protein
VCNNQFLWNLVCIYLDIGTHLSCVFHKSLPLICLSVRVSLLPLLRNGSVNVPAATNTRNNGRIFGRVVFYEVLVSQESMRLILLRTSCFWRFEPACSKLYIKLALLLITVFILLNVSLSLSLYDSTGLWTLAVFQFLIVYTVSRIPWMGDQPIVRPLSTQTQNKRKQTSMPWVGFEPMIPAFKRAKTVHALDCAATVIGLIKLVAF